MNTTDTIVPYKIDDEQFGKLIDLPKLYQDAKNSVASAKLVTDKFLTPFRAIADITKVEDLSTVETILIPIRTLRAKLAATKEKLNAARSPYTIKMRDIVSALVAEENAIEVNFQECKKADDLLQAEIARRSAVAKVVADKKIADANAKTDRLTKITLVINTAFGRDLAQKVLDMHTKFYSFKLSKDLYEWIQKMKGYEPTYTGDGLTNGIVGDAQEISEVNIKLMEPLKKEWITRLKKERDDLVDKCAGRMEELISGSPVERVVSIDEFVDAVMDTVTSMNSTAQDEASKQKLDATFENTAAPSILSAGNKGKVTKKKYKADTIEALQAIMQSWVRFNMNTLSIEELNKKLSFMRTAADARLNEGQPILEAKGLSVIDDISTRTQRPTTNA